MSKKPRRIKIGDVYAIPLPNAKYAFGKVFKDAGFGVAAVCDEHHFVDRIMGDNKWHRDL